MEDLTEGLENFTFKIRKRGDIIDASEEVEK